MTEHLEDLRAAVRRYTREYGAESQWPELMIDWPALRAIAAAVVARLERALVADVAARLERAMAADAAWVDGRNWVPEIAEAVSHARELLAGIDKVIAEAGSDG
jgi:hypothetical protein